MVEVPNKVINHVDFPQALILLGEMNVSAQHVATLVDKMIQQVHKGEISTNEGLNFLEMKYNLLLSYLINLTYVVLRKCSGESIAGDPCINRLVEIRTVLEKIRPIDRKLKYQIDKLVKIAVSGHSVDDPTLFKANPSNLKENSENNFSDGETEAENSKKNDKKGLYVPPKLSAVHFIDETAQAHNRQAQERMKKLTLSSALLQDLRDEYLDTPIEISQSSRAQQIITEQQQERQDYEEKYLTRLPVTKAEKRKRHRLTTVGMLGEEVTNFRNISTKHSLSTKHKRLYGIKSRKNFKRKRYF